MFQATTDSIGGASVTSDLTFEAGPPGKIEVFPKTWHLPVGQCRSSWNPFVYVFRWSVMLSIRRLAKTKRPSVTSFKLLVRNPWSSLCIVHCMGFITKTLFTWIDGSFVAILADIIKGARLIVWCLCDVRSMYWWMSVFVVGVELATIGKWEWRGLRRLNCHTL